MSSGNHLHPIFAQVLNSHARVTEAVTPKVNCFGIPDTYRGWTIEQGPDDQFYGTGPNYDAWTEGEGEWVDNGERCSAPTWEGLREEIDAWFVEQSK